MTMIRRITFNTVALLALLVVVLSTATIAQTQKAQGVIKARSGEEIVLQVSGSEDVVVVLTDTTDVAQVQGVLKARNKKMSMAALVPGLSIQVEGTASDKAIIATKIRFKGNDLEDATKMQAAMHETKIENQKQQEELEKHNAELAAQNAALKDQQAQLNANKAAINEAIAKFGQLDDYYILDEVTVYFANGKVVVDPKFTPQLLALTDKAKTVNGYMIEVKGYASAVGSAAINQKLSVDRANNVTTILLQQGKVPLTRMLAPGAMGESEQVADNKTSDGQAENRRVVVRVLQNKAVAGI
jgi:OmpA-OmpF porin, OOP family